ncbi:Endosulfine-domain-containing protein [Calocera viscosa TUFC12733]|uniref:mRNA stability protein n=1 Tax=Calocera viscosa (strain TUFC12733) TaxID=1330018 RepID=A0A167RVS4_CALVF|nr:Endosulfine-domain-containing protein [Calocera viscosa TUFC12733]
MLPAQRKKVDLSTMTEEEKKLFSLYGKLPNHKNVLMKMQKDRKYFDSGDYALSKAGVAPENAVGTAIPSPESIPHASPPSSHPPLSASPNLASSPVKDAAKTQGS